MECLTKTLDKCDALAYKQLDRLHLSGKKEHTSSYGGFCTCCLFFILLALTGWKTTQVFQYDGTYHFDGTLPDNEEIFVDDSQKYVFYLTDLFQSFDFDPAKLDMYIGHWLHEFDQDGNRTKKGTKYEIKKCNYSDFKSSEY